MGTFYVVRHAKAGSRGHWSGDDRLRPLSKKGFKQAAALVAILEPFPITAIYSSPFRRCVQTIEPVARTRELAVKESDSLAEGHGLGGAMEFMGDRKLNQVVLSTHGDIVWELVEVLVKRKVVKAGEGGFEKGSMWVVDIDKKGSFVRARYIPAP
ncbi:MAG: histidine phosphatase family protein [Candidatus Dormibacteraeota bacterium]|nr:histidine phosphatase family protein [Candidatus Dormibacteraeota bacterium]